jgi:hypothetical protein
VPLERGAEVVIVTVEHGLALVEPWEQFMAARENRWPVIEDGTLDQSANTGKAEPGKE